LTVLFLTHRLPYAPNRGDRVRAYFLLQFLRARAQVDVISLVHDEDEASHARDLDTLADSVQAVRVPRLRSLALGVASLATMTPTTHAMLDAPDLLPAIRAAVARRPPDVVLAYCSGMARLALLPPLQARPLLLDMVDVDSAKWQDLGRVTAPPLGWVYRREARVLRAFEARAARHAAATMVVTGAERDTLQALAPSARVHVVPNGVDVASLRPASPPAPSADVVFCGVMNYPPNERAAHLLAREVWPLVRRTRPDATLHLVGSSPSTSVRQLASDAGGIVVTGAVPDVRQYLWSAGVAAAPLFTARGIQNKVLEAVAAGLPVVVTPNVMASLPPQIQPACVAASNAAEVADALVRLLALAPGARRAMADRADTASLTWDRQLAPLDALLDVAVAQGGTSRHGHREAS
jgi:sugar transferase (PEP-CTERM/EpsH1 system associated)